MNQKTAKALRRKLGVKSRANRTYTTQDGAHHTQRFDDAHHKPIGARAFTRETKRGHPVFEGTLTLSKHEPRHDYQRIKHGGMARQVLAAEAA
ncbi:hypothetical protein [Burkholderia sp. Bp8990]|uniref:hypothetical protein n=1 Tax=Burkholderia sp. Bp8990 TaxID=2184552 RepID=UPI000F5B4DE1|nr:hypothetical protein [Burkholderia sp. Bp8990]RQS39799.1 hypothetical protein DIE01_16440 [Burkholderia sp. Bp8990]